MFKYFRLRCAVNKYHSNSAETRQRLLVAAGEMFAEKGFHAATVRDICQRAGVNIAAVNYYFRSKEELYESVCNYSLDISLNKYSPTLNLRTDASPEERLHTFVRSFLFSMLDQGQPSWHETLVTREMHNPTKVLDSMVETTIKPRNKLLFTIVRDLLGKSAPDDLTRQCCFSIIGQCLHYRYAQPVICRLNPKQKFDADSITRLADHITRFSLCALQQLRHEPHAAKA
jgi:AcrR family transcriptional regulator